MYEIIYINEENIYFNTGYNPKILNRKNYQRKYPLESLKFVYPWIFLEPRYITSKTERKNYLSRVHFDFDGEKNMIVGELVFLWKKREMLWKE